MDWFAKNKEVIESLSVFISVFISVFVAVMSSIKMLINPFNRWRGKAYFSNEDKKKIDKIYSKAIADSTKYFLWSLGINILCRVFIEWGLLTLRINMFVPIKISLHIIIVSIIGVILIRFKAEKSSDDNNRFGISYIAIYWLFVFVTTSTYTENEHFIIFTIMQYICYLTWFLSLPIVFITILKSYSNPDLLDIYIVNEDMPYEDIKENNVKIDKHHITITVESKNKSSKVKRSKIEIPVVNIEKIIYKYYR